MKQLFILAATVALCSCGNDSNKFTIKGNIDGLTDSVFLFNGQDEIVDSAAVKNGAFRIKGTVTEPSTAYLISSRTPDEMPEDGLSVQVILEPGTIVIAKVPGENEQTASGTPANDAFSGFLASRKALIEEFRNPETPEERRNAIESEFKQVVDTAFEQNLDNYFSLMLAPDLTYEMPGQQALEVIQKLSPALQQTADFAKLKSAIEARMRTEIGQRYIDIVPNNAAGEPVSLKSVIENPANKYTLVDFWASWCGPCMGEVPVLKKTYDEFHKKGFEIYGVSFDNDSAKWLEAVKQNGMNWIQVSDLNSFDNQAAKDYSIQGIPSNFLIDSTGTIIASNLRGEKLYEKIAELLAE